MEPLGPKYGVYKIDIWPTAQKQDWFLKLNPNGRIPTIVDPNTNTTISESGAILQYLVDTYDKDHKFSYKYGTPLYYKQLEVLYFQMAGVGPMFGQYSHFARFAKEKIQYGIDRYRAESIRLTGVLEEILARNEANSPFLVGDHISIADIAVYPWIRLLPRFEVSLDEFPKVKKFIETIDAIPEVQKGLVVIPPNY